MATGRMLKKNISKSEKFTALKTHKARMIYLMILPHLDKEGRLDANPKLIKGQILPLLNITIAAIQSCLEDMFQVGLIDLYTTNDAQFLEYTKFSDFQILRDNREADSEIPPAPSGLRRDSVGTPAKVKLSEVKLSEVKYTVEFESFWKSYPERWIPESDRHVKIGKHRAWEYWDKLNEQTQKLVLSVLPVFARTIPPKIVPDAWRWLRDKKWKDYSVPNEKPSKKPQPTQSLRDKQRAEWTNFIKEAPEAKLVAVYEQNVYGLRWLIDELRPEIKDNFGKGVK